MSEVDGHNFVDSSFFIINQPLWTTTSTATHRQDGAGVALAPLVVHAHHPHLWICVGGRTTMSIATDATTYIYDRPTNHPIGGAHVHVRVTPRIASDRIVSYAP